MCFGSKDKTPKTPAPTPSARFDYMVPQPKNTQQQQAAANAPDTDPLGQAQLGAASTQPQGSY